MLVVVYPLIYTEWSSLHISGRHHILKSQTGSLNHVTATHEGACPMEPEGSEARVGYPGPLS